MAKKRKKSGSFIKLIVLIVIAAVLANWSYRTAIHNPVDKTDDTSVSYQIKKGATVDEIASGLEDQNLIKNSFFFKIYVRANKLDTKILAGRFVLNKTMNVPQIIEVISDPSQAEFVITIQEGLRIKDIDDKLVDLGLIGEGEFTAAVKNFNGWQYYDFLSPTELQNLDLPLEGFIYPDTYFLDPASFTPEDLIYLSLDNFEKKWNTLDKTDSKLDQYSLHQIVTMASIIENEVFGAEDRHLVSGILWKRLESDWTIGADATLLYITEDRTISGSDLQLDSPYNTRKNLGLPPGPISNPSIESIEAALHPTDSSYWFYLNTLDTGEVIYAESNEQHNANRAKYL